MKHFKGFVRYTPEKVLPDDFPMENIINPYVADLAKAHEKFLLTQEELGGGQQYLFWKDERGYCWYDLRNEFDEDTFKVVYDPETFKVTAFGKDANRLSPIGNVVELATIPDDIDFRMFKYDPKSNTVYRCNGETLRANKLRQTSLLRDAAAHFLALQLMDVLDSEQQKEMLALKKYIVEVKRTVLTSAEPAWPDYPL